MTLEEDRKLKLKQQRSQEAISLAMLGHWQQAVETNNGILALFPEDVDTHNRLGRAYLELGDYNQSREFYSRALKIDPYNAIARKNLQRLSYAKETVNNVAASERVEPYQFIEEIGKAGVVSLYDLVGKEVLAKMAAGNRLQLKISGANLTAVNRWGEYLGKVDQQYARRLIKMMNAGNQYSATVVSVAEDAISIIIRETYQDPSQVGRLSFLPKRPEAFRPYGGDGNIRLDDYEEGDSGYTIVGGDEIEVMLDDMEESDDDEGNAEI